MPNLFPRCCVLLLLAATSAVAQRQTDVASPGTGSVTGHVYCADTQKPARFAEVRLASVPQSGAGGFGGGERFGGMGRATTGPDGSFLLENVPPGDYLITARTPGYIDTGRLLMSTVIRNPNDPPPAALVSLLTSVHVTAGQPATASVTIYRGAVLAGVVSYDDGTPAYGVTVSALAADGTQTGASAMSDDRGVYRVTGLLDGTYILQARPFGPNWTRPLPVYYGNTLMKTAAKKLEVKAGDERDGLDLQIQVSNLRQVSGIVQSAKDGHGLGRATISMTLTGEGGEAMNTSSLPDGSFRFQNVPDGKFTVSVSGAQDHNTSGDSSLSYGGAQQNIEVHGGDIDHVVFNLTTSGSPSPGIASQ